MSCCCQGAITMLIQNKMMGSHLLLAHLLLGIEDQALVRRTNGQVALEYDVVLRGVLRHGQQLPVQLVLYIINKLDAGVEVPVRARDPVQVLPQKIFLMFRTMRATARTASARLRSNWQKPQSTLLPRICTHRGLGRQ